MHYSQPQITVSYSLKQLPSFNNRSYAKEI